MPCGTDAVLVEVDEPARVLPLAQAIRSEPGVVEVVPGVRTALVRTRGPVPPALRDRIGELAARTDHGPAALSTRDVTLDVHYDGADLASTAAELDISTDDLVALHSGGDHVVAFCGFAPGFAYVSGLDPRLHVTRLSEPRIRVPAGSVAIAGGFTGVYPRESPGGWRLLGRTDARLWDVDVDPPSSAHARHPAPLAPGMRQ